jgi:hypothetical protein
MDVSLSRIGSIPALLLLGCAHADAPISFDLAIMDRPHQSAFEITLTSRSSRSFCFSPEFWPNPAGWLSAGSETAFVTIDGVNFPTRQFNQGYCPGADCWVKVRPGQTISGRLRYETFDLPAGLDDATMMLHFAPLAFPC